MSVLQSIPTTETITSPSNARVRSTMKLRDATARRQTGLTLIDGQREIQRCLTAKKEIVEIFENTKLGKFKVNINVGKNLGELK